MHPRTCRAAYKQAYSDSPERVCTSKMKQLSDSHKQK